jgi:hypothetical protein
MLAYSAAVTLILAYVGVSGATSGVLLWPAVVLHAILTALLARAGNARQGDENTDETSAPPGVASPPDDRRTTRVTEMPTNHQRNSP